MFLFVCYCGCGCCRFSCCGLGQCSHHCWQVCVVVGPHGASECAFVSVCFQARLFPAADAPLSERAVEEAAERRRWRQEAKREQEERSSPRFRPDTGYASRSGVHSSGNSSSRKTPRSRSSPLPSSDEDEDSFAPEVRVEEFLVCAGCACSCDRQGTACCVLLPLCTRCCGLCRSPRTLEA